LQRGKVALITGSTSGIGKGTAIRFVKDGAQVVVTGRREELGKQVAQELNKIREKSAIFVKYDITELKILFQLQQD
jgi:NAD(P)-dependent dehydrogenase (short-subunit alcohol dehydrogenase family)